MTKGRTERYRREWLSYIRQHTIRESQIFNLLKRFFRRYEAQAMNDLKPQKAQVDIESIMNILSNASLNRLITSLRKSFKPIMSSHAEQTADGVVESLGFAMDVALFNPMLEQFIDRKIFTFSDSVAKTTIEELRKELSEGYQAGENIQSLKRRVQKVFDGRARGVAWHSRMIARTETTSIFNGAKSLVYQMSEVVSGKMWLTAGDEKVRVSHAATNRQTVEIDQPFMIGGYQMLYPGDSTLGAGAGELVNCRCTIVAEVK